MKNIQRFCKSLLPYLAIFIVGFLLLSPLFVDGFYPMHDDTQVTRVHQMAKALSDGMFPVRWVPDLGYGYGYPIFNFYAPLAYYVGSVFVLLGFSSLTATKVMIAIPLFIAGIGMYLLSKLFWGRFGGVISAFLVMSAPYVAVNIFVRGAISEYYAYSFIPLVFYSLIQMYKTSQFRYVVLGSVSFAFVVLSHNLTAMMVLPFLLLFLLFIAILIVKKKTYSRGFMILFLLFIALLLSGFYWLPAIAEMGYTNVRSQIGGGADFRDHFVCIFQLWESQWGYGGSVPGCVDGMSYKIGKLHIFLGILTIPLLFFLREKQLKYAMLTGLLFAGIAALLLLPISQVIWDIFPPFAFIQYPWRFLSILTLAVSFIAGASVLYGKFLPPGFKRIFLISLLVGTLVVGYVLYVKLFQPQTILPVTSADYTREDIVRSQISAISDEYLPPLIQKPETDDDYVSEKVALVAGVGDVEIVTQKTQDLIVSIHAEETSDILIQTAYFPSWTAYVERDQIPIHKVSEGMIVTVPKGEHTLRLMFEETLVEKIGNAFSVIGITVLIIGIITSLRKKTQQ